MRSLSCLLLILALAACSTAPAPEAPTAVPQADNPAVDTAVPPAQPGDSADPVIATPGSEDPAAPTLAPDAAAGGQPDTVPTADIGAVDGEVIVVTPVTGADLGMTVPLIGTAETAVPTEEVVDPGAEPEVDDGFFDSIIYEQTGGPLDEELRIEVYRDGRLVRNGEELTLPPAEIEALNAALSELNFFGLRGQFVAAGQNPDAYYYSVEVNMSNGDSRTINAQDGHTPQPLLQFFSQLNLLGVDVPQR
jgi:hypothetical protein